MNVVHFHLEKFELLISVLQLALGWFFRVRLKLRQAYNKVHAVKHLLLWGDGTILKNCICAKF